MKFFAANVRPRIGSQRRSFKRFSRWLPGIALLVAIPKCFACVIAYASLTAAITGRLANAEICGRDPRFSWHWVALAVGLSFLQIALFPNRRFGPRRRPKARREMATTSSETRGF